MEYGFCEYLALLTHNSLRGDIIFNYAVKIYRNGDGGYWTNFYVIF